MCLPHGNIQQKCQKSTTVSEWGENGLKDDAQEVSKEEKERKEWEQNLTVVSADDSAEVQGLKALAKQPIAEQDAVLQQAGIPDWHPTNLWVLPILLLREFLQGSMISGFQPFVSISDSQETNPTPGGEGRLGSFMRFASFSLNEYDIELSALFQNESVISGVEDIPKLLGLTLHSIWNLRYRKMRKNDVRTQLPNALGSEGPNLSCISLTLVLYGGVSEEANQTGSKYGAANTEDRREAPAEPKSFGFTRFDCFLACGMGLKALQERIVLGYRWAQNSSESDAPDGASLILTLHFGTSEPGVEASSVPPRMTRNDEVRKLHRGAKLKISLFLRESPGFTDPFIHEHAGLVYDCKVTDFYPENHAKHLRTGSRLDQRTAMAEGMGLINILNANQLSQLAAVLNATKWKNTFVTFSQVLLGLPHHPSLKSMGVIDGGTIDPLFQSSTSHQVLAPGFLDPTASATAASRVETFQPLLVSAVAPSFIATTTPTSTSRSLPTSTITADPPPSQTPTRTPNNVAQTPTAPSQRPSELNKATQVAELNQSASASAADTQVLEGTSGDSTTATSGPIATGAADSPSSPSPSSQGRNNQSNTPLIVGSVIGAVIFLSILIWTIVYCCRRRPSRRQSSDGSDDVSPFISPPNGQNYPPEKTRGEWERMRGYFEFNGSRHPAVRVIDEDGDVGRSMGHTSNIRRKPMIVVGIHIAKGPPDLLQGVPFKDLVEPSHLSINGTTN
ncbi:hypothetical protein L218DRAFT_951485 [Marasmius fiardii PR-910]|nr:hypothetical protein L218DRAFT_951485 [Marasmius fiardii PR-910]